MQKLFLGISLLLFTLPGFSQQRPDSFLSVDVSGEDWGIRDWSTVQLSQLSVLHERAGNKLHAQVLSDAPPPEMPKSPKSATPRCDGNCLLVSGFDWGSRNHLGGQYSAFAQAPSTARASLAEWEGGYRALTLDFSRAGAGFCGMWVHLFDSRQPPANRVYMNIGNYAFLTFWIRGLNGGEQIRLKASDADWEWKGDAMPVGDLNAFLPRRSIETGWQQAVVPLAALPRKLDRHRLASLVFEAVGAESGRIAVKNLAFCLKSDPLPPISPSSEPTPANHKPDKAMWVWNTAEILPEAAQQAALADFCLRHGIGHLYLQLPKTEKSDPESETLPLDNRWQRFLALLAGKGIRGYALDGYKDFALPKWHQRVLGTIEKVIAHNRGSAPNERFAGIHYDIEPYLISGFHGPGRQKILTSYLELLEKMSERVKSSGMKFGVDIPFWYDTADALTGKDFAVEFHGKRKPASEHIIDLADSIGIMDYRTSVFGADGIASQVEDELAYAANAGKKIFVGLETIDLPDEDLFQFKGKPERGLPERVAVQQMMVLEPALHSARIWLIPARQWNDFLTATRKRTDSAALLWWPVTQTIAVPSSKLTFAHLGPEALQKAMHQAGAELLRWPSFSGFALHDYTGLQTLLEPSQ